MLESKRRAIIFISLSLLLAVLAGVIFLQKVKALNNQLGDTTSVYVAKTEISSRSLIKPEQVKVIEIPNKYVTDSHITNKKELINKVSVIPLTSDDIIMENMLKDVSTLQNQNNRLISMLASEKVRFDQDLNDLDRVDIIVSQKFDGKPKTELFMSDVPVAMVARGDNKAFKGVALEVPIEDAPKLIHMQNYADSVRILKANVGQGKKKEFQPKGNEQTEKPASSTPAQTTTKPEKPAAKPPAQPATQPSKKE
jgi:pilus assembly protein CpaB